MPSAHFASALPFAPPSSCRRTVSATIEGEGTLTAQYVTYAALSDMLGDTNRLGIFNPGGGGVGRNVVGSGAAPAAPEVIPLPAGAWLLAAGCLCLAGLRGYRGA